MGFLLRSAFWLGIVYGAMPFDVASTAPATTSTAVSSFCPLAANALQSCLGAPATACGGALAALCAPLQAVVSRAAERRFEVTTPQPAQRRQSSRDTLTSSDRVQPWRGPPPRSQG